MCMHVSSVLVAMSVYTYIRTYIRTYVHACVKCVGCYECIRHAPPPPTQVDCLFVVVYLFYQSMLERFVF